MRYESCINMIIVFLFVKASAVTNNYFSDLMVVFVKQS